MCGVIASCVSQILIQANFANDPTKIHCNDLAYTKDWDDSQTDLAHLDGAAPGAANAGGDQLWEASWDDDDDVEDDFSVQLR